MTDQIYYQVQYPIKKAINILKKIEVGDELAAEVKTDLSEREIVEIKDFVHKWNNEGKSILHQLISDLRNQS